MLLYTCASVAGGGGVDSVSARKAATRPETHSAALEEEHNPKRAKGGLAVCLQFTVHCIGTRSKHWKKLEMQCNATKLNNHSCCG